MQQKGEGEEVLAGINVCKLANWFKNCNFVCFRIIIFLF